MPEDDLKEIRRLRPGERISKLKELEEKKKREIEEAERLIEDSIAEIRGERIKEEIEVPEPREVDISRRFLPEEEATLERVAAEAEIREEIQETVNQYATRLEELKEGIYENPERAYEFVREAREQMERLSEIGQHYTLSGAAARAFSTAANIYEDIKRYRV